MARACSRCGTVGLAAGDTAADEVPAGWSFATTERGIEWLCLACARENVRSIEAKLPEEYW